MLIPSPAGSIERIKLSEVTGNNQEVIGSKTKESDGFSQVVDMVSKGINTVNNQQLNAQNNIEQLATGQAGNLHDVILAIQEANMSCTKGVLGLQC